VAGPGSVSFQPAVDQSAGNGVRAPRLQSGCGPAFPDQQFTARTTTPLKVDLCYDEEEGCDLFMKRHALIFAAVGLIVCPAFGCTVVPSQVGQGIPADRSTPIPLRVLPQGVDDVVAHHTAILRGPHDPKDMLGLAITVDSAGGGPAAITAWARSVGFTVTDVIANASVGVIASTARIEQALHIKINDYRLPDGYAFRSNDRAPSVPASLNIFVIVGLSTYYRASTSPAPPRPRSNALCGLCMLGGRMRIGHALVLARTPLST